MFFFLRKKRAVNKILVSNRQYILRKKIMSFKVVLRANEHNALKINRNTRLPRQGLEVSLKKITVFLE